MTYQPPGAYPGMPPYPGGAGAPPRPPLPETVRRAFLCMLGGAALSAASAVVTLTQLGQIRSAFEKGLPSDDPAMINSLATATIVVAVVAALVEIGLWLWMAFAAKAGKNYARIVGTVFFGVNASGTLFGTAGFVATSHNGATSSTLASSDTTLGQIVAWLMVLVGLAAVVLLWRRSSGAFFKPQQFYPVYPYAQPGYGYAQSGYPYGQPGYGYPAAGYGPGYGYPPGPQQQAAPQQQASQPQTPEQEAPQQQAQQSYEGPPQG